VIPPFTTEISPQLPLFHHPPRASHFTVSSKLPQLPLFHHPPRASHFTVSSKLRYLTRMKIRNKKISRLFFVIVGICLALIYINKTLIDSEFHGLYYGTLKGPRIFCLILTTEGQLDDKATLVYNSWARFCDNHTFISTLSNYSNISG